MWTLHWWRLAHSFYVHHHFNWNCHNRKACDAMSAKCCRAMRIQSALHFACCRVGLCESVMCNNFRSACLAQALSSFASFLYGEAIISMTGDTPSFMASSMVTLSVYRCRNKGRKIDRKRSLVFVCFIRLDEQFNIFSGLLSVHISQKWRNCAQI